MTRVRWASLLLAPTLALLAPTAAAADDPNDIDVRIATGGVLAAPPSVGAVGADVPVDVAAVLAKEQLAAQNLDDTLVLLAEGQGVPANTALSPSCAALADGCSSSRPPAARTLPVSEHAQTRAWFCVPASVQIILMSQGYGDPTQDKLANEMSTNSTGPEASRGTFIGDRVPSALNRRVSKNYYAVKHDTKDATDLLNRTITDVGRIGVTYLMRVDVSRTRYFPTGWTGDHAIVTHGYYTSSGGGHRVFDPDRQTDFGASRSFYGYHTLTTADAWRAVAGNNTLVW